MHKGQFTIKRGVQRAVVRVLQALHTLLGPGRRGGGIERQEETARERGGGEGSGRARGHGAPLLQQAEGEARAVVAGGGREAGQVHHRPWPQLLERRPQARRYGLSY